MSEPGFAPCCDNGRVSGGSGGSEHRYHFPGVDCARRDEASYGGRDDPDRGQAENVPESKISTMGGPRSAVGGAQPPLDKWRPGFSTEIHSNGGTYG